MEISTPLAITIAENAILIYEKFVEIRISNFVCIVPSRSSIIIMILDETALLLEVFSCGKCGMKIKH
jgi:hypothetical protein